jgi:hypothetical protein
LNDRSAPRRRRGPRALRPKQEAKLNRRVRSVDACWSALATHLT